MQKVVIGIDGGGSYTRVAISDSSGELLGYAEGGSCNINKDSNAASNVQQTIKRALEQAKLHASNISGLVAGLAGLDSEQDLEWASKLTDVAGLDCPKWHLNDTLVAHAGAFLNEAGIVAIAGTGSKILAINEKRKEISNYDFHQYASSAARFLAYEAVFEMLAGRIDQEDEFFVQEVLTFFNVTSLQQLLELGSQGFVADNQERTRIFGVMGPIVTNAAKRNSPLAQRICDRAAYEMNIAIQMLGSTFHEDQVLVTGIGSVVNDPYVKQSLKRMLAESRVKQYKWIEPQLGATFGGILLAFEKLQIPITDTVIEQLKRGRI